MKLYLLHGPNLNLLGQRETEVYGSESLADIERIVAKTARSLNPEAEVVARQTNDEGELVSWLHEIYLAAKAGEKCAVVLNPGAFTHYSYALGDALSALNHDTECQIVELHISNPAARDEFRRHSVVSPHVAGTIAGFGVDGYRLAVRALLDKSEPQGAE